MKLQMNRKLSFILFRFGISFFFYPEDVSLDFLVNRRSLVISGLSVTRMLHLWYVVVIKFYARDTHSGKVQFLFIPEVIDSLSK